MPVTADKGPEAEADVEAHETRGCCPDAAFDREFANYMVQDHKNDIVGFREARRPRAHGQAADLARRTTLPVLRKHLATAEHLADVAK